MTISRCFIQDKNINITNKTAKTKRLEVSRYFRKTVKEGRLLSVRNIGKPQVAFVLAVLSFMFEETSTNSN